MKRIVRSTIRRAEDGSLLLDLLCRRFTYHTPEQWQERLAEGRLLVNQTPGSASTILKMNDVLEYRVPPVAEPPVPLVAPVVYEDTDLLAIAKPAGLPVHPAGRFFNHTLWALLREERPDEPFEFVNRLDRETSGLVLLGRHAAATRACRRQMQQQRIGKQYLVLVEGRFPERLDAAGWLCADETSAVRKKRRYVTTMPPGDTPTRNGCQCMTRFRCLGEAQGVSLLLAEPHSGRLHQIRATLCSLGCPVVGDKLYGVDSEIFLRFAKTGTLNDADHRRLRLERQALHAWRLALQHPATGAPLHLEAPLPPDMTGLCRELGLAPESLLPAADACPGRRTTTAYS